MELVQDLIVTASLALLFSFVVAKFVSLAVSGDALRDQGSRSRLNAVIADFLARHASSPDKVGEPPSPTEAAEAGSREESGVVECLEELLGLEVFESRGCRGFEFDRCLVAESGEENADGESIGAGLRRVGVDFHQSKDASQNRSGFGCFVAANEGNTAEGEEIRAELGSCSFQNRQGEGAVNSGDRGCGSSCLVAEKAAEYTEGDRFGISSGGSRCGFDIRNSEDASKSGRRCSCGLDCLAAEKEAENTEDGKSGIELGSCSFDIHQSEDVKVTPKPGEDRVIVEEEDDWEGIERSDLEHTFADAAMYVGREGLDQRLTNVSSDVQMQLYGLYKVAMEGPCYEPQPMALKVSARAKWNAWQKLGNMSPEEAMEQYIALLSDNVPGWMGGKPLGDSSEVLLSDAPNPNLSTFLHNQVQSANKRDPELKTGVEGDGYWNRDKY